MYFNVQKHRYGIESIGSCRKLEGIMARLGQLSEQHWFLKFLDNVDNADTLNGFIQGLAYAITDYQVCNTNCTEQAA